MQISSRATDEPLGSSQQLPDRWLIVSFKPFFWYERNERLLKNNVQNLERSRLEWKRFATNISIN